MPHPSKYKSNQNILHVLPKKIFQFGFHLKESHWDSSKGRAKRGVTPQNPKPLRPRKGHWPASRPFACTSASLAVSSHHSQVLQTHWHQQIWTYRKIRQSTQNIDSRVFGWRFSPEVLGLRCIFYTKTIEQLYLESYESILPLGTTVLETCFFLPSRCF